VVAHPTILKGLIRLNGVMMTLHAGIPIASRMQKAFGRGRSMREEMDMALQVHPLTCDGRVTGGCYGDGSCCDGVMVLACWVDAWRATTPFSAYGVLNRLALDCTPSEVVTFVCSISALSLLALPGLEDDYLGVVERDGSKRHPVHVTCVVSGHSFNYVIILLASNHVTVRSHSLDV
jgi:hypothetical protein